MAAAGTAGFVKEVPTSYYRIVVGELHPTRNKFTYRTSIKGLLGALEPKSAQVGDWTDPKKLKEIAKELQRQLQRKEADALRLTDRVQKLISLRDEQLAESQAERRRLHYALEQEEVEVQIV